MPINPQTAAITRAERSKMALNEIFDIIDDRLCEDAVYDTKNRDHWFLDVTDDSGAECYDQKIIDAIVTTYTAHGWKVHFDKEEGEIVFREHEGDPAAPSS